MVIPVNIRYNFYPTKEDVKMENKFCALPVILPLEKTMEKAYPVIQSSLKFIKSSFPTIFALYALSKYIPSFIPKHLQYLFIHFQSEPYTLAFSNTPGPIKPIQFKD